MLSILNSLVFNVALGVPLVQKSNDTLVEIFRLTRYVERNNVHFATFTEITIERFLTFLMTGPLGDKKQKGDENVENKNFSLDPQLNYMFSTYSPLFCCLSTRGPDISHPSLRFLYIFGDPGLLWAGR